MTHPPDHLGHADLDSIRGQLDEVVATERAVNVDRTDRLDSIEERLRTGAVRMANFETLLTENTDQTVATAARAEATELMTRDVHDMLLTWRAGMNALAKFGRGMAWVGQWVLRIAKFGGAIAGGIYAIWMLVYTFTHGGPKS